MSCFACDNTTLGDALPPREGIVREGSWRVAHAFDSALLGWLILIPTRHLTAIDELSSAEAADMGRLLHALTAALKEVTGCLKTYVMLFAEAEGFAHLHVHLVPRMPWFTAEQKGPAVFSLLGQPFDRRVSAAEQDALALRLRERLV